MTGSAGLAWIAGFVLLVFALAGRESKNGGWRLAVAVNVGLLAFLLQDMINFAFFVPAARTTFCAGLAAAVAMRCRAAPVSSPDKRAAEPQHRVAWGLATASCGLALIGLLGTMPAAVGGERLLRQARALAEAPAPTLSSHPAHLNFLAATDRDPWDATAPTEHAQWLMRQVDGDPARLRTISDAALAALQEAVERSPQAFELRTRLARIHLLRGRELGVPGAVDRAVAALRDACALYPQRPMSYVELGICLAALETCAAQREALVCYRRALALDDARPGWETFRRFSPRVRQDVADRIARVNAVLGERCGD